MNGLPPIAPERCPQCGQPKTNKTDLIGLATFDALEITRETETKTTLGIGLTSISAGELANAFRSY